MELWLKDFLLLLPDGAPLVWAVFLIAFIEALVGIGLVMPGSVLTVFCGWLAFHGKAPLSMVMLAAGCGALLGDLLSFWCGARFAPQLWQVKMLVKRRKLLRLTELFFLEHGGKSLLVGRFLGPVRGLVPFVAGAGRMAPGRFLCWSLAGGLLWGICYPGVGYLGGSSWQQAETLAGRLGWSMLLVLSVGVAVFWLRRHFLPKRER